ncbi:MAG: hypothetical protein U5L09_19255 [Bacteroidales bacterium]|nr:hypothetical protein [Bacteroidales bacterium]
MANTRPQSLAESTLLINSPEAVAVINNRQMQTADFKFFCLTELSTTTQTDYTGPFAYADASLSFIQMGDYRIVPNGDGYEFQYYLKDHLGNNQIVFNDQGEILQDNSYYPFGMRMEFVSFDANENPENKYLYNAEKPEISDFIRFSSITKDNKIRSFIIFGTVKNCKMISDWIGPAFSGIACR